MQKINYTGNLISEAEEKWEIQRIYLNKEEQYRNFVYHYELKYRQFHKHQQLMESITDSFKLQEQCSSDYVIKNYNFVINQKYSKITVLQEYYETTLAEVMPADISYLQKLMIIQQIGKALKICHSKFICHRLISPFSIAVTLDRKNNVTAKLNNFTDCRKVGKFSKLYETMSKNNTDFDAPEIIDHKGHDLKCDVWSIGAIFYWLIFGDVKNLVQSKQTMTSVQFPPNTPKWLIDIISPCLEINPTKRCNVSELVDKLKAAITCADAGAKLIAQINISK